MHFIFGLILILSCSPELSGVDKRDLYFGSFDWSIRESRVDIAKDILEEIDWLLSSIPTLTPDELEWREVEKKSIQKLKNSDLYAHRLLEFAEHPIQLRYSIIEYLQNVHSQLSEIVLEEYDIKHEMVLWSELSYELLDHGFLRMTFESLIIKDVVPATILEKSGSNEPNGYADMYNWYGRGILQFIITNYLADA